jgi:WD40 repeat protein
MSSLISALRWGWRASGPQLAKVCLLVLLASTRPPHFGATNPRAAALLGSDDKPELVLQTGHTSVVQDLRFSPDGRYLISGSTDRLIRLWEISSGRLVNTLRLDAPDEQGLAVSPAGDVVAIRSRGEILLWDWQADKIVAAIREEVGRCLAFSPTGAWLVAGNRDGSVNVWDTASRTLARTLRMPSRVQSVAVSHGGKLIAAGGNDGSVLLWSFDTGELIDRLPSHQSPVLSVNFSEKDETLDSVDVDEIKSWDILSRRGGPSVRPRLSASIWALSDDNRVAASATRALVSLDYSVRLVDVATDRQLKVLEGHKLPVTALAFSPDGRVLATGSWDTDIKLWDLQSGRPRQSLEGNSISSGIKTLAVSRDGKYLVTGGKEKFLRLWDLASGELIKTSFAHSSWAFSAAFSPDHKLVASVDSRVRLWDADGNVGGDALPDSSADAPPPAQSVSFAEASHLLAYAGADKKVRVWDTTNKRVVREFTSPTRVAGLSFASDDRLIAILNADSLVLWNRDEDRVVKSWNFKGGSAVAFSPDGSLLASGGDGGAFEIHDTASFDLIDAIDVSSPINALSFSAKYHVLAVGCEDGSIRLWDVAGRKFLEKHFEHERGVTSLAFLKGGETLVSGSDDTTVKFWGVGRMQLLATIEPLAQADWIVFSPDGFFDGTRRAWSMTPFRFPSEPLKLYEPEQFFNQFYQPGLLADVVREGRPIREILRDEKDPRADIDISRLRQSSLPQVRITGPSPSSAVSTRTIRVVVEATDTGSGAQDCRVFRNQSLVHYEPRPAGATGSGNSKSFFANVQLPAGRNEISAYCFNRDGLKSKDESIWLTAADDLRRRGTAYLIVAGINTYANSDYNLRYAAGDAKDFGERLRLEQTALGRFEHVEVIPLLDEAATRVNILAALEKLSGASSESKQPLPDVLKNISTAQPEDAVIIFFSGHGTAQQGHFYLIPHDLGYQGRRASLDEAGLKIMLAHSISDAELESALRNVDAGTILLIIDACNSGQALEAEEKRRGPMNSRGLAQLAYEKGMYVLAAAQSYQAAWELSELNHGLLTYALIVEGLKDAGGTRDTNGGELSLRGWLDFAAGRVPQMQMSKMLQCKDPIKVCPAVVEGEERITDIEKRSVQRPRVFYRHEESGPPLIIARKG